MPNPSPSSETLDGSSYARKSRLIFVCPRFTKVTKIAAQQHIGPRVIRMLSEIMTYRLRSVICGVLFPDVARSRQSINAITPSDVSAVPVVVIAKNVWTKDHPVDARAGRQQEDSLRRRVDLFVTAFRRPAPSSP